MDSTKKPPPQSEYPDSDADLNLLLYKFGRTVKNSIVGIGRGITGIGKGILMTLLFLIRNIWWLLAGAVLGLGYGLYQLSNNGSNYSSEMTLKANFNSSRELYNTMDYLNALIAGNKVDDLSKIFNISASQAKGLAQFTAEPAKSELITAQMYKDVFLQFDRSKRIRQDTFWLRTIKYEDFKESLTKFDYPFHNVKVITTNPSVFSKLQYGIINYINNNALLQEIKEKQLLSNADEERILSASINNLDTLRKVYNERLLKGETSTIPSSNQLMLLGEAEGKREVKIPEIDLYDKVLELQDELQRSRYRSAIEKNIIAVYSPFNPIGKKVSLFQSASEYSLTGLCIAAGILLLIALYRWLVTLEAFYHPKKIPFELPKGS